MPGPVHNIAHLVVHMQKCFVEALLKEDLVLPQKIENFIDETYSRFLQIGRASCRERV